MQEIWDNIVTFMTTSGWNVVKFLAILAGGIILIRIIVSLFRKALIKSPIGKTLANFIVIIVRFLLYLILLFTLMQVIGIPMAPLVTALGSVALAVGLALKDCLANLANGVVIMGTKPFAEGDYVKIGDVEGTVKAVRMLTTELSTADNIKITVPNSVINASSVINYSARPTRRVEWKFSVSYDSEVEEVKSVVMSVLKSYPLILELPAPMVRLTEQGDSALVFTARAWVNNGDYWTVNFDIGELVYEALKKAGIEIPYNQLDVHVKSDAPAVQSKSNDKEED